MHSTKIYKKIPYKLKSTKLKIPPYSNNNANVVSIPNSPMSLKISPLRLFQLDALEKRLEVSRSESLVIVSLDDLDEDGGTILEGFGEDLQDKLVIQQDDAWQY